MKKSKARPAAKADRIKAAVLIALMVLFTVLLVADLVNLALPSVAGNVEIPSSAMEPRRSENAIGEALEQADGANDRDMPSQPNGEEAPEMREMGERGALGTVATLRSALKEAWLPILLVCLAGDGVCLFLLLRIRRRSGKAQQAVMAATQEEGKRRSDKGAWVLPACLILAIAVVVAMLPSGTTSANSVTVHETVVAETAQTGDLSAGISGAGTLESDEAVAIEIPEAVSIQAYYVSNGDTVKAGDPLVAVDSTSVASAIAELQTVMDELDEALQEEAEASAEDTISATAEGRVKAIYAGEGDRVWDVISDQGALMLLSLDGLMAVDIEDDETLAMGDTVQVLRPDGTALSGRIAQVANGKATVTVSDEDAAYGERVTVTDGQGATLGEGELYIHSELKVTGYYGTVSEIEVSLEETVEKGDALITLNDTGHTSTYEALLARRHELEEQMEDLFRLYEDGVLYAESEGVASGIPEDAPMADAEDGGTDAALSSGAQNRSLLTAVYSSVTELKRLLSTLPGEDGGSVDTYAAIIDGVLDNELELSLSALPVTVPDLTDLSSLAEIEMTETLHYSYEETTPLYCYRDGQWTTLAFSELQVGDRLILAYPAGGSPAADTPVWIVCEPGGTDTPQEPEEPTVPSTPEDPETSTKPSEPEEPTTPTAPNEAGGAQEPTMPTLPSVSQQRPDMAQNTTAYADGALAGQAQQEAALYETYSVGQQQVLSITPQETAYITISVDELDILALEPGQTAAVTLDAIPGQSFTGTVTEISAAGTNEGGNTKFGVKISLPRTDQMLAGMNASVTVVTATNSGVVTIPAAALVEDRGKTYVYTTYDEKTDSLGGMTEVETGMSDGERVEIRSGLQAGDAYYYRYADTVTYHFLPGAVSR